MRQGCCTVEASAALTFASEALAPLSDCQTAFQQKVKAAATTIEHALASTATVAAVSYTTAQGAAGVEARTAVPAVMRHTAAVGELKAIAKSLLSGSLRRLRSRTPTVRQSDANASARMRRFHSSVKGRSAVQLLVAAGHSVDTVATIGCCTRDYRHIAAWQQCLTTSSIHYVTHHCYELNCKLCTNRKTLFSLRHNTTKGDRCAGKVGSNLMGQEARIQGEARIPDRPRQVPASAAVEHCTLVVRCNLNQSHHCDTYCTAAAAAAAAATTAATNMKHSLSLHTAIATTAATAAWRQCIYLRCYAPPPQLLAKVVGVAAVAVIVVD
eukprot:16629-Heterococcus_DN1.PRE.2